MRFLFLICISAISLILNAQDTINGNRLFQKNGQYYLTESNTLFTGTKTNYHSNGQAYNYIAIRNGHETGEFTMYFDSGQKRMSITKIENTEPIKYKIEIWNEDGSICFQGIKTNNIRFKSGSNKPFTGSINIYYNNGNLAEKAEFNNGKWNGKQIRFFRNGVVEFECIFEDNTIIDCPVFHKKISDRNL